LALFSLNFLSEFFSLDLFNGGFWDCISSQPIAACLVCVACFTFYKLNVMKELKIKSQQQKLIHKNY
jgi:hypothetical protein